MQARGPVPSAAAPSWFGRNWKWVVPVGCFSVIAAFVAFLAGIFLVVFGFLRSSDVYQYALARASSNDAVVEALGEPVEPGWYLTGSIEVQGASGQADVSIPIAGPRGKGTIFVSARKTAGRWDYQVLEVEIEGREERIDLRE
jgi:hypothetical protein